MINVGIIADDLTGANTNCALFAPLPGVSAVSLFGTNVIDDHLVSQHNVVAISTNSRAYTSQDAAKSVSNACQALSSKSLINKRVDSTLRGNIGSEIGAVLNARPDSVALVVAAYPVSKRITKHGVLYVDNIPVSETAAGHDIKMPVTDSAVSNIIHQQLDISILNVDIDVIQSGSKSLLMWLTANYNHERVIVFDAVSDKNIDDIAEASYKLFRNKIISVDPGPFTYRLAKLIDSDMIVRNKYLLAIGSVSDKTMQQIEYLKQNRSCFLEKLDCNRIMESIDNRTREEQRVVDSINQHIDFDIIGIVSAETATDKIPLSKIAADHYCSVDDVSKIINQSMASITCQLMQQHHHEFLGLYTSGGDIAEAVCEEAKITTLQSIGAVMPQVLSNRVIDGPYQGTIIVSKGGLIGDADVISTCLDYLKKMNEV